MMFFAGMILGCMIGLIAAGLLSAGKTEDLYRENEILKIKLKRKKNAANI